MSDPRIEAARETLAMIGEWLSGMERWPNTWGPPHTLETVCLTVVETRQRLLRPAAHRANQHETREAWGRFVASVNGEPTSSILCDVLRDNGRLEELPNLLGDAQRWIARELPPEISYEDQP